MVFVLFSKDFSIFFYEKVEKWLSKAEYAKEKLIEQQKRDERLQLAQVREDIKNNNEENDNDEENSPYYKHCTLQ